MARVTLIEGRTSPLLLRLLNWGSRRMLGQEAIPFKVLAHNPRFLLPYLGITRLVQGQAQVAPEIRALAMHLVADLNGCAWCLDFGRLHGGKHGVSAEKLDAVGSHATSSLFSLSEQAALAYAAAVTQVGARVSDATFATLRQHFSEQEIVELTVAIAAENMFNRLNVPLEVESQGFCVIPRRGGSWRRAS